MSKEDELAKEQAEVVPNTYGDLHDAPVEYIGEGDIVLWESRRNYNHTSRYSNN